VPLRPWAGAAVLLLIVAASTALSQFFRASTSVIGPELIRDLALSSEALALANASFFMAMLAAQVPVGIAFDRFGARATVAALSLPMAAGAMLHGMVDSGAGLAGARFLVGLGCAGSFGAGVVLITRWFPQPSWSTALSWHFALSQVGLVLAGTPLAAAVGWVGWRFAFLVMGLVALTIGYLFFLLVRNEPPGLPASSPAASGPGTLEGLRLVLSMPDLPQLFCLFVAAFAALATVQVLWAGPYLNDVHHLDAVARGNVLLGMALAQTLGVLIVCPLDRLFNTRKWVVVTSVVMTLLALTGLALGPGSLEATVFFLCLLSGSSGYGGILYAHIRSLFPDHLAGRSATISNMAPLLGGSIVPALTGFIPPLFPSHGPGYSPLAYQAIFSVLALCLAAALAVYLTVRDSKPRLETQPVAG
jgi:MFS family permease